MDDFFLRELKSRVTLSSFLGSYLRVTQKGSRKMACCPFHKEKSPSFYIDDDKGSYHCFGCGVHGDAISFLMNHLSLSFPDAVKELCVHTGTPLPEFKPQTKESSVQAGILTEAFAFMQERLKADAGAKKYLVQRAITKDVLEQFGICYGGREKDGLYKFLKGKGFSDDVIAKSGVCIKSSYGSGMFDRFSNRIIFPIWSSSGKIIAFSGRIFNGEKDMAKYVNSPETEGFKKSYILYNFHNARKTKERVVIVCEGFMDVIAFYKDGISNAVAQMGTAFTKEHLQLLVSRFEEIAFCLDGDNAGIVSQKRVIEMLFATMTGDKTFSFVVPRGAKDPDEYLEKHGGGSLKDLFERRLSLHEHAWDLWSKGVDMQNPLQITKLEKELEVLIAKNPAVKKHYQSFFRNKIYKAKFQKQKTVEIIEQITQDELLHETNAIAFAYTYYDFLSRNEDLLECEVYFKSQINKILYDAALAGEDISGSVEDIMAKSQIPSTTDEHVLHAYYMLLYSSSLLYKVDEEIKESAGNFQNMVFLAKERQRIVAEIGRLQSRLA